MAAALALLGLLAFAAGAGLFSSSAASSSSSRPADRPEPAADEALGFIETTIPTTTERRTSTTVTTPPKRAARVLVIGDSLAALGAERYRSALTSAGFEVVGYHAVSGTSIHDLLAGDQTGLWTGPPIEQILASATDVDVVYLSFGTNDHHPRKGRSNDEVLSDGIALVASLRAAGEVCIVWQTSMSSLSPIPGLAEPDAAYAQRLVDWWPATALLADQINELGTDLAATPRWLGPDGIHLSEAGIIHNASAMTGAIKKCLEGQRTGR